MEAQVPRRRIGKLGWLALIVVGAALILFAARDRVRESYGLTLLDRADQLLNGSGDSRAALVDGRYGPLAANRVDVIVPSALAQTPRPIVIFIHGGGWNSGNPGDYHFIGRTLARAGYVVVLPGYRLTPAGVWPHMLEDGAKAVAWTRANAARFGADPDRIVLMGHSAGAYNAVQIALERQWLGREGVPDGVIKGAIGLSGPYDFYPYKRESTRTTFGHVQPPQAALPTHFVRADAPPLLLITGDADATVNPRDTRTLADAMHAVGGRAEALYIRGAGHDDTVKKFAAPFSRDRRVLDPVLTFLAAHTVPSAPVQQASR